MIRAPPSSAFYPYRTLFRSSFTIAVTNLNDNPVVGPSDADAGANTVAENAANGTVVGVTALASDADAGATISYSLSDDAGGRDRMGTRLDSSPLGVSSAVCY